MIKVSVLYKNTEACRFDMEYYCKDHIPMVRDKLGDACKGISVEQGIVGEDANTPPPFVAIADFFFDSVEAFQNAFNPHADLILADVPNYTNAEMVIQFSKMLINASRSESGELHLHMV